MYKYQIEIHHKTERKWDWIAVYVPIESDQAALQAAKTALYNYTHPIISSYDTYQKKSRDKYLKEKWLLPGTHMLNARYGIQQCQINRKTREYLVNSVT